MNSWRRGGRALAGYDRRQVGFRVGQVEAGVLFGRSLEFDARRKSNTIMSRIESRAVAKMRLLEELFLIKRIPGWSRNLGTRATAAPKLVFVDSGIAARLLALEAHALRRPGAPFGPLIEGFVLSQLARQLTWSQELADLYHYRDHNKVEVDGVLENRQGRVIGIEVKAAATVRPEDFHGLRQLAAKLGDDFIVGIVLYTGNATLPFGSKMRAVPVSAIWLL